MKKSCWKCGAPPRETVPASDRTRFGVPSSALEEQTARLLATNDSPWGLGLSTIRHLLVAERDRTQDLLREIEELRSAMELRAQELQEAKKSIENHTKIMSAVRRVPTEIICEIFSWTLPYNCRIDRETTRPTPWYLGHICRRWRAAAIGIPVLWTSISFYASRNARVAQEIIETQLCRSGNAPLHLTFHCQDGDLLTFLLFHSSSINLLFSHSVRWQSVNVRVHAALATHLLQRFRTVKGQLPSLRTLEFFSSSVHISVIGDIFSVAPRLQEVRLRGTEDFGAFALPQIPWRQISHYRGSCPNDTDALKILEVAPNMLEYSVTLTVGGSHWGSNGLSPYLFLPHLRRLGIHNPAGFFQSISAPSLQELWISGGDPWLFPSIQRSGCTLVKLVLQDCSEPARLIAVLQASPVLTTFYITFTEKVQGKPRKLFDALKLSGGPSDICLHLSRFAAGGPPSFAQKAFLDTVESRWYTSGLPRLAFVRIICYDVNQYRVRDAAERLAKMRREGLDAEIDMGFHPWERNYMSIGRP